MYVVSCRHSRRFRRDRPRLCHSIKAKDGGHDASRYHRQRNGIHRSGRQPSSGLLLPSKISIVFKRIIRQSFALFSLSFVSATFDADMGENFVLPFVCNRIYIWRVRHKQRDTPTLVLDNIVWNRLRCYQGYTNIQQIWNLNNQKSKK